jgi:hypothetical protein
LYCGEYEKDYSEGRLAPNVLHNKKIEMISH